MPAALSDLPHGSSERAADNVSSRANGTNTFTVEISDLWLCQPGARGALQALDTAR